MSEFEDENPVLIQSHSRRGIAAFATPQFPLILFHDGAGTLFSYFLLQTLGRDVFGFEDPSVASGDKQTCGGGVREMAAYYYASMKGSMRPSPVILGGWSFGGHLALQLAHLISSDETGGFKVAGIVLIDTSSPSDTSNVFVESSERHNIMFKDGVPEQMKEIAQAPMDRAARMVSQWTPPLWSKESAGPPKALLLRATESFDPKIERSPKLGWESYPHDFIALVVPIPGNHFTIFELDNVASLSRELRAGCDSFETLYRKATEGIGSTSA